MVGNQHFGWRPLYWTIWSESEIQPIQQFKGQHKFFGPTVGQDFFDWPTVPKIFTDRDVHQYYGENSVAVRAQKWTVSWTVNINGSDFQNDRPDSTDHPFGVLRRSLLAIQYDCFKHPYGNAEIKILKWQLKLLFSFIFFVGTSFYHIWNTCFTRKSLFHSFV